MAPKHEIADKLIDWMELNLKITSGPFLGEDFEVMDWQRKFIRGIFKQGISTAVCSTSRGNGKDGITGRSRPGNGHAKVRH